MKQTVALILIALLLCTVLAPYALTAEESSASAETETSETVIDSDSTQTESINPVPPAEIILTHFDEPDRADAVAFAVGTTQQELSQWFSQITVGFVGYDAEGNSYDFISGEWYLEDVDNGTVGLYSAFTSPALGTEYTLADGVSLPRQLCAVSIQSLGEPDINCCVAGRGFLHFPWVISAAQEEQLNDFAVWLRQDGGEWLCLTDGFLFVSDGLRLSQQVLTYGSAYEIKVTYPGGRTGVLSVQYDGELSILDYSGGDRDGGDVDGGGSGIGTQPAPTPPKPPVNSNDNDNHSGNQTFVPENSFEQPYVTEKPPEVTTAAPAPSVMPVHSEVSNSHKAENVSAEPEDNNTSSVEISESQEPAPVIESYSPTQTVISGMRLKELCKEEESVVFGSGDLTVSIPSKLLLALNLSDTDTLTVTLTQPQSNQISIAVEVYGKSVTQLSGTVLRLRYIPQTENADITIQNNAGEQITDVSYDGEVLRFAADASGTYIITEISSTQEAQKSISPLLPVSSALLLSAVGIAVFRRRRHG